MMKPVRHIITRSKGCRTCRARKIKCDQTHPFCRRCVNSKPPVQCQGYSEPVTFLHENPQPIAQSLSSEPRRLPYPAEQKHVALLAKSFAIGSPAEKTGFSWLRRSLDASEGQNYLMYASSRCLAQLFYGRHLKQYNAITDAVANYGQMLQVLRLEVPKLMWEQVGDLVHVILTCIITEAVLAPTVGGLEYSGLHAHIDGIAQIFRTIGARQVQQKLDVVLFGTCRCYIAGRAVNTKTPTFLADDDWKTIPWKGVKKSPFMKLWDILCDVPSFLHDLERLSLASIKVPLLEVNGVIVNPRHPLRIKLTSMLQNLFNWRWNWELHRDSCVEEVPTNPSKTIVTDLSGNPHFQTCLCYSDETAKDMIYYQATLTFLLRMGILFFDTLLLDSVDRGAPPSLSQPLQRSPLLLPSDVHSLADASSEYYRSIEGHLCISANKSAAEFYGLAFGHSLVTLGVERDSVEERWTTSIRRRIFAVSGFDIWAARRERDLGQIASLLKPGSYKY